MHGEGEAKIPSFLAKSTNNSHVSFESMDKTADGQTIERTHDPRTTSDRVILIPLPLRVAELLDMYGRAGTTRTYTELHAIRIVCFSLLDRSLVISFLSLCFSIQARALRAKPIHLECQSSWRSVKLSSILRPLRPSSNISQLEAQARLASKSPIPLRL